METTEFNTRILVIDDDESVRESFLLALKDGDRRDEGIANAAADFFDDEPAQLHTELALMSFEVDIASSGRVGFEMVREALAAQRPYAVIFCDMRMPGWNGLTTIEQVRELDQRCEIIFVTAYTDQSLGSLVASAGADVGYFLKPFAVDEIKQMATRSVISWNKAREMERLLRTIISLDGESSSVEELLQYLLGELCLWIGTGSGALARIRSDGQLRLLLGRGELARQTQLDEVIEEVEMGGRSEPILRGDCVILPIREFGLAIAMRGAMPLTPDRVYLLRVFLEHAGLAIRNSKARAELARARRLAAIGETLGGVIHDIRSPLATARMFLNWLGKGEQGPFAIEQLVAHMNTNLDHIEAVVGDTLDYIRGEVRVWPQEVSLERALRDPLELIKVGLDNKSIALRVDLEPELTGNIDIKAMVRMLRNLVENAAIALTQTGEPRIEIGARRDDRGLHVWVTDNGPGIPEEIREQLFEPFVTSQNPRGTGLGLAIVKQLAEAHGGTVSVTSSSAGTCFDICL